jgi:hypothetical protein
MKTMDWVRITKKMVRKVLDKVKAKLRPKPVPLDQLDPREFEAVEELVEQEGLEAL